MIPSRQTPTPLGDKQKWQKEQKAWMEKMMDQVMNKTVKETFKKAFSPEETIKRLWRTNKNGDRNT